MTPCTGRVNSSRAIQSDLLWEIAAKYGKKTVAGGVPMSYPPRPAKRFPGFFLGDFLSPADAADFASDPAHLRRARTRSRSLSAMVDVDP